MPAPFYARRPPALIADPRFWLLLTPAIAATAGSVAYAAQGFAVSNGGVLPADWVSAFARWGGVLLAVGCEGGTLSASAEVWRKRAACSASWLDYGGLCVSFVASVVARVLALAMWRSPLAILALILASAADAYVLLMELGGYAAYADDRQARWLAAQAQWAVGDTLGAQHILSGADVARVLAGWPARQAQLAAYARTDAQPDEDMRAESTQAPRTVARVADWRRISAGLNGERAHLTADEVAAMLTAAGYALPQARTLQGWAQAARQEVN